MKEKQEIRATALAERNRLSSDFRETMSKRIALILQESEAYRKAKNILIYLPIGSEVDPFSIIKQAWKDGKTVSVPHTNSDLSMEPLRITEKTTFQSGKFGIMEPSVPEPISPQAIDLIILPCVAADQNGNRIGYGKGCYDRFLAKSTAIRIAILFDMQVVPNIPAESTDIPFHFMVTERGMKQI